ncbi:MAG: UDP-N-acetylmuramate--L-alanine ligase [bacterium]|nr:UDP-N-acetylmuramate--L-alanine ligase [bacterium]
MKEEFLKNIHHVHFIGPGGVGISAVARFFIKEGKKVTGTEDNLSPETLDDLRREGAVFSLDLNPKVLPIADCYIYSIAWLSKHSEVLEEAKRRGIPCYSYPESLGMISRGMRTIAVSGTHGKTTTTAMIAGVLVGAHKDPTVIVGSLLKSGANFIAGKSDIFVVEACEYKRSFLNLSPEILVITNIDNDHLDYYGTIEGVQKAFAELVEKVPETGAIVCDPSDPLVAPVLSNAIAQIVDYTKERVTVPLQVAGEHNIKNARATLAAARILGVDHTEATRLLALFEGTWRRMEYKGKTSEGALVYDDYAHHPTEIKATLQGFRSKYPNANIRVIFQPHLYSRTKLLLKDFSVSFWMANDVIIAPIYAAREKPDDKISAQIISDEITKHHPKVRTFGNFDEIVKYLQDTATPNDVIITMGAGDIYKVGEALIAAK